jgi:ribonuclease HII
MMIGIDEVGRGSWAGPLLVVAVRERSALPPGLRDSKRLTKKQRQRLSTEIELACDIGEGWVAAHEIDQLGLTEAMRLATVRALAHLKAEPHEPIIFDGHVNYCHADFLAVRTVIGGDALHPIVSAASIYAKVRRDSYMAQLPPEYAVYEFGAHVGYGTRRHGELIRAHGVSDMHRHSFAPIKALL